MVSYLATRWHGKLILSLGSIVSYLVTRRHGKLILSLGGMGGKVPPLYPRGHDKHLSFFFFLLFFDHLGPKLLSEASLLTYDLQSEDLNKYILYAKGLSKVTQATQSVK